MGRDPQEEEAGRFSGLLSGSLYDHPHIDPALRLSAYQLRGYTPEKIRSLLEQSTSAGERALTGTMRRRAGAAGSLGAARGRALGLSNPYAFSRLAENDVAESFADEFGRLNVERAQAPLRAIDTQLNINQQNLRPYLALLQMLGGNVGNRAGNVGTSLASGVLSGAGQVGAAYAGKT